MKNLQFVHSYPKSASILYVKLDQELAVKKTRLSQKYSKLDRKLKFVNNQRALGEKLFTGRN